MSLGGLVDKVDEPTYANVIGLVLWGLESAYSKKVMAKSGIINTIPGNVGETVTSIKKWLGKFLP
jgi:hypothetical protein